MVKKDWTGSRRIMKSSWKRPKRSRPRISTRNSNMNWQNPAISINHWKDDCKYFYQAARYSDRDLAGAGDLGGDLHFQSGGGSIPEYLAAQCLHLRQLYRRRRANGGANGGHSHRGASQRYARHGIHDEHQHE